MKVEDSPGVLTAEEEDTTTDNTNNNSPRPVQKLGEALRKHESRSHANKNKEQLQEACKTLGLKVTGNKTELRRRIIEREREKETAASFFSIKVAGGPKPAPSKLPDPPGFNSTPKKPNPNILPITPSSRRKREDDSINEAETPSKKVREDLRNEDRKEEDDRSREDLGKT